MRRPLTLRRKLLAAFVALAAIALLVAGVALYTTLQWQRATTELETHYRRSLLLQRVRAETFQALKEVDDALTSDVEDARRDFEAALEPAARDFAEWAELADTPAERAEVARIREAHERLIRAARQVFRLILVDRDAAERLVDDELDTGDYARFRLLTEAGVDADRARRRDVQAATETVRNTAQLMLAVSAISIISLILLISAYLSNDLFRPIREVEDALRKLRMGDVGTRIDEDRDDELGAVAKALNALAEALQRRDETEDSSGEDWRTRPSNATLHRLVAALQARIGEVVARSGEDKVLAEVEQLARAVARFTAIGYPLDLQFEHVDVSALIHDVAARYRSELAERSVALELSPTPGLRGILVDRLKLREALGEALRNALDALPEEGGRIGIRSVADAQAGTIRIEIADAGRGMDGDLIERALGGDPFGESGDRPVGLSLAKAVVERHGGALKVFSEPGRGTVVQFNLPDRR